MALLEERSDEVGVGRELLALGRGLADAARDVGEDVERAFGHVAGHALGLAQPADHEVAPVLVVGDMARDQVLRPVERRRHRRLADGRDAGRRLALHVHHRRDHRLGAAGIADAPAGHGIGLRGAVHRERALLQPGLDLGDRVRLGAVIGEMLVDLVRHDQHLGMLHQHLGELAQFVARAHRAGRVVGEVEHHPLGVGRDRRLEIGSAQLEMVVLRAGHRHRHAAAQLDLVGIADPAGRRHDHLVARIHRRHGGAEHDLLAAVRDHDLVHRVVEIVLALELALHRLLQRLGAVLRRILGLSGERRLVGGLDGVPRRHEVGLARRQADDLDTLRAQLAHFAGHRGRGGNFDVLQTLSGLEHAPSPISGGQ